MACKQETPLYVGPSEIAVENGRMTPEVLLSLGRLSDPQLSPDGQKILYGVSYTSIEDNRSCRNLFICNPDGTGKVQITRYAKSVSCARWSLDGNEIFFLQGGQLWKAPLKGSKLGKKVKLSDVPAGISEYKLSPDQASIMYISTIPGPVKQPKDVDPSLDKAKAYIAEGLMYRHWDHWVTETPRTYVSTLSNGTITPDSSLDILGEEPFELPTEPFGGIEQLDWSPDGRYIVYSCRKLMGKEYAFSTNTGIYIYDILTGATLPVKTDGGYDTDPAWSPDGASIAWISMERDGYEADKQRLMVADVLFPEDSSEGQSFGIEVGGIREVAGSLDADVSSIYWMEDSDRIVFPAMADGIGSLWMVSVKEAGSPVTRLTGNDWWYDFGAPFACSDDGQRICILTTFASMTFPTEMVRIDVPCDGSEPVWSQIGDENGHILSQLAEVTIESIHLTTELGEDLQCWVVYPPQFDPSAKYPAVEMFNGGPQSSIGNGWSYRWNFFLMAQQGYVAVLPNRHGNTGFGQAWKEQISGDYQGLNMQDLMQAGRWAKSQEWCTGIAGVGASYGGFSVYNLMGIHGDIYDCFISHAGIFDEKMMWYTTEEAWFGNWDNGGLTEYAFEPGIVGPAGDGVTFGGMQQAGAPYASVAKSQNHYAHDPESRVTAWHTPLLCMHGMMDYRIPYEQGMAAFNAAQMMGVPSKLVIFPEENHWILQPQNALLWHREFFGWLEQWLKD